MHITKNKLQIFVTLVFLAFFAWWISFQHIVTKQGVAVQWFGGTYELLALIGAVIGFVSARKWGGFKAVLGKAIIFFSLGLLAQGVGELIYTYYINGAKIQIPYPSWGDVAYFGSVLLYITAALFLAKAAGAGISLKQRRLYKLIAVLVPIAILSVSYYILLYKHQYDTSHPLTVFLDAGYPVGEAIYISIAVVVYLLSRKLLGGLMKPALLLLIGALIVQYIADFNFVFQSNRGTFLQGEYGDFLYVVAYFVMTTALIKFKTIHDRLSSFAPAAETQELQQEPKEDTDTTDQNGGQQ